MASDSIPCGQTQMTITQILNLLKCYYHMRNRYKHHRINKIQYQPEIIKSEVNVPLNPGLKSNNTSIITFTTNAVNSI